MLSSEMRKQTPWGETACQLNVHSLWFCFLGVNGPSSPSSFAFWTPTVLPVASLGLPLSVRFHTHGHRAWVSRYSRGETAAGEKGLSPNCLALPILATLTLGGSQTTLHFILPSFAVPPRTGYPDRKYFFTATNANPLQGFFFFPPRNVPGGVFSYLMEMFFCWL